MHQYNVAIYLRLSREDERLGESGSITTQRDLLKSYIKENNLNFVQEYVDDGVSGTTFNRRGFNKMIDDIENKKINMVITKDTSRLGRDHIEFGYYVEKYFPEHGVRYVAVTDGIDTSSNSSNNDMLVFKSAFNDMYVKDISNKMRASINIKKKNGEFVGCYAPYGYKKDLLNRHKLVIDEEVSFIVKRVFNMFAKGIAISKICEIFTQEKIKTPSEYKNMKCGQTNLHIGVWSTRTVTDILKNPTYIGNLTQCRNRKINYKSKKRIHLKKEDWIIKENSCPAIIDKQLFEVVQNMFLSNKNRQGNGITDTLLLRGLIFCKDCHHTIGFRAHKQETKKYGLVTRIYGNCNYWVKRKKEHVCTPHSVKYEDIEDIVLNNLYEVYYKHLNINDLVKFLKENDSVNKDVLSIKREIIKLKNDIENNYKKIEDVYYDKLEGIIDIDLYKKIYDKLILDINNKDKKIKELNDYLFNVNNNMRDDDFYINKIKKYLDIKNINRNLIANLIEKIEIDENKNINIYYKINIFN